MKQPFLLIAFLSLFSLSVFAQENNDDSSFEFSNHEVRLDGIKLIAGTILEANYEYVFNKNSGAGISVLINLDSDNDYPEDFSVAPFYRFYFLSKQDYGANGFFVEGFGKIAAGDERLTTSNDFNYTDVSLGMSLGKKWINSAGFVFELLVGVSRTLGGNPGNDVYFRGGLFVGYRFK